MYSLKDLVLFNTEGWFGLYQTINSQYWPLHLVGLVWGFFVVYALFAQKQSLVAIVFVSSAGIWFSCAIVFHLGEYQQLSWVAVFYGWAFIAQAMMLFLSGLLGRKLDQKLGQTGHKNLYINTGYFLLIAGIVMMPVLGLMEGRDWTSLDVIGVGPDSTALATIGLVLLAVRRKMLTILLCAIPTMWLVISAATAWPLGLFQGVVSLFVWLLVIVFLWVFKKRQTSGA